MSDNRCINEDYCRIARDLIENRPELEHLRGADVTILCLSSDCEKKSGKKLVFGQCEKIADKYKWGIPCDFTITIFEPNIVDFSEGQLQILIFHELLHVGVDGDKFSIIPHDLEDFKVIIEQYGVDWNMPAAN